VAALLVGPPAMAGDGRADAAALDATEKAAGDYAEKEFATATARLEAAVRDCAAAGCTAATRALVLRDLGTMQLLAGDEQAAMASFGASLALNPSVQQNPQYD